jgi:GT2 family glycosyltransferase
VKEAVGVAIAISTLDRPDGLARCLQALGAGSAAPARTIVVDQGSTPAAAPGAELVRDGSRGLSASRNAGVAAAAEAVVAFTDDDCVPSEDWVAAIAAAFEAADPPDAVTGPVLPLGPDAPGTFAVSSRTSLTPRELRGRAVPWEAGTGGNLAVRRDLIAGHAFDERLGAGSPGRAAEDVDLLYRLLRSGARIRYEPRAVVYHERQSAERRRASRGAYGHGIGAFCALRASRRDLQPLVLLGRWAWLRLGLLTRAVLRGSARGAAEELAVLAGTVQGLAYGVRARRREP